jgi:lysophospholipase L1-like esterase
MFKSRYSSYSYKGYRQSSRLSKPWVLLLIILVPCVSLILLELLVRAGVWVAGKNTELQNYQGEPANITAYRLKFLNQRQKSLDGLPNNGQLAVQPSQLLGYKLMGNQSNDRWRINAQGFRDDQPISRAKPKGEYRIFILGGSTAFGQLAASNQATVAGQLENRLNQQMTQQRQNPGKFRPLILPYFKEAADKAMALPPQIREYNYQVINAAVPGYASANDLAQLVFGILPYSPDLIIVLNGYPDLLLPSHAEGADIPGTETLLGNPPQHFFRYLIEQFQNLVAQTYVVKATQYWLLKPQPSLTQSSLVVANGQKSLRRKLPTDAHELTKRVNRYNTHLQTMARLTAPTKVPLLVILQPEITGQRPERLTPKEQQILQELGDTYRQQIKTGYAKLNQSLQQVQRSLPKQVTTLNLYDLDSQFKGQIFQDAIHLTDAANAKLADRLYAVIIPRLTVESRPFQGTPF